MERVANEIDGRASRRRTESQVDGPSDDKVTEGTVGRNTNFPQMTDVVEFPLRYSLRRILLPIASHVSSLLPQRR